METTFVLSASSILEWLQQFVKTDKAPAWVAAALLKITQYSGKKVEITIRAVDG